MEVRKNIKKYLTQHGISIKWLSDKTGYSVTALSMTLNLKRSLKADEYFNICNALEVPVDKFVTTGRVA